MLTAVEVKYIIACGSAQAQLNPILSLYLSFSPPPRDEDEQHELALAVGDLEPSRNSEYILYPAML